LYIRAFPVSERRSWEGLEHELLYEKKFHPQVLLQDNQFVGFLNYWKFDEFDYIEHFAVTDQMRNKQIGTEAMEIFMKKSNLPIILEVEMPKNSLAERRIKFYERLGFLVLTNEYSQPPYNSEVGDFIPILIMSNDIQFANSHFDLIKETLYDKVYHWEKSS
jgi:ribosomal protein S18 acetylase RimI-like enzyme